MSNIGAGGARLLASSLAMINTKIQTPAFLAPILLIILCSIFTEGVIFNTDL